MNKQEFASLHNHSEYSMLDSMISPREMMDRARELGYKSIAITDHGSVYSHPYFEKIKGEYSEIKLIYGCEFYTCLDMNIKDKNSKYYHMVVLAKNDKGRKLINKLITESYEDGFYHKPRISIDRFPDNCEDIVVSTACLASILNRETNYEKCIDIIKGYKKKFKHFYLEIQSSTQQEQKDYNKKIISLSKDTKTKVVVTTDSHYLSKDDRTVHNIFVNIQKKDVDVFEGYNDAYMKSVEEIHDDLDNELGKNIVDWCIENTMEVANLVDNVDIPFGDPKLPHIDTPNGFSDNKEYIKHLCMEGMVERKLDLNNKEYLDRIDYELSVINGMDFTSYFLLVREALMYAKSIGVPVGPARGSGASSLVCFLIGITDINPIKYKLYFERFLNKERLSYPDLDTDLFEKEQVIRYLEEKYGKNRVCQISNFSYITPKVSIKDTARVLNNLKIEEITKKDVENISSLFVSSNFDECIEINGSSLEEYMTKYPLLFGYAKKISGRVRNTSIHAGGLVISQDDLTDGIAVTVNSDGTRVMQCDKKLCEQLSFVKIDLLGLGTLGVIDDTLKLINKGWDYIDVNNDEFLNDKKTYDMLSKGDSEYIFQFHAYEAQRLLQKVNPKNIEDLSVVTSLLRPDSVQYISSYLKARAGEEIDLPHEDMKKISYESYGIMILQEQILNTVRHYSGRSLGQADILRRSLGSKDPNKIKEEADKLQREIVENGYSEEVAVKITDDLRAKGNYCFNKAHAVSYSTISYQTAFLKANFPVEFFASNLIHAKEKNDYSKLGKLIISCKEKGIEILPPNINKSEKTFTVKDGKIYYGIGSIKSVGEDVVERIISNRPYKSVSDVIERCGLNKRQATALIYSGAFGNNKEAILKKYFEYCYDGKDKEFSPVKSTPSIAKLKSEWGIVGEDKEDRLKQYNEAKRELFVKQQREKKSKHFKEMNDKYMLSPSKMELQSLSVYLTHNPFESITHLIRPFDEITHGNECVIAGTLLSIQNKKDRNGRKYCYADVLTLYGIVEIVIFSSTYAVFQEHIKVNNELVMKLVKQDTSILKDLKTFDSWKKEKKIK